MFGYSTCVCVRDNFFQLFSFSASLLFDALMHDARYVGFRHCFTGKA